MKNKFLIGFLCILFASCSNPIVVSINQQTIYDPGDRIRDLEVLDADLQGCINLALQQQDVNSSSELSTLSCANAEISELEKISFLPNLRFLDLGDNKITNITPLEELRLLGGLNLRNNLISDIGPLFNMPNLSSVNLEGNNGISCTDLVLLRNRFGENINLPNICED